jgi:CDP-diacylglycerol--serine O-phosphatidyltransferase
MPHHAHFSLYRLLPNVITLGALCSGMTAIRFAMLEKWELAVTMIVIAAFLDGLDGRVARLLKATSNFGAQLDSLSDFLCFGVAPALVMYLWTLQSIKGLGWAIALFFAICCCLRLARFNTSLMEEKKERWQHHYFTGVPAPAGALLALLPLIFDLQLRGEQEIVTEWLVVGYLPLIAVLMVSRIPTYSLKGMRVKHRLILPFMLLLAALVVGLMVETWATIAVICLIYLVSIVFSLWQSRRA